MKLLKLNNMIKWINVSLSLILFLILMACNGQKETGNNETNIAEYDVLETGTQTTTIYSKFPVNIQGQQQVEIRPMVEGYIEYIYVDEGAVVKKGQPLFRIKAPQYEQEVRSAQAEINIAQENVNIARTEVEKIRPLVNDNIISQYELQTAQNTLNAREAILVQAKTRLENARTNLGYTTILSPVDGIIGLLPFKIGSLVGPTTPSPLTYIANVDNVYAYFSINEKKLLELSRNNSGSNPQEILKDLPNVKLLLADGSPFNADGKIETTSGFINPQSGAITVRATFPNTNNIINSGSSGTILIPQYLENVILIPQNATYEVQDKKFVYLVDNTGMVSSKEIKVKTANDGKFYIVEQGLQAGDKLVLDGIGTLKEDVKIAMKKVSADDIFKTLATL